MSRRAWLALLAVGCGSKAEAPQTCDGGCRPDAGDALCPAGLQPTFSDINARFFQVGCLQTGGCHTSAGAAGQLVLETGGYANLVNQRAANLGSTESNPPTLYRVLPNMPDASFVVIKLGLKATADPAYGHGMPYPAPGSTCQATVDTIRQWISAGAPNN